MSIVTKDSKRALETPSNSIMKSFAIKQSCESGSRKPGKDLCRVAKSSGHMKPGYQNFQVDFQISSVPVPRINNDLSLNEWTCGLPFS